jgi:hypothetical protein
MIVFSLLFCFGLLILLIAISMIYLGFKAHGWWLVTEIAGVGIAIWAIIEFEGGWT